MKILKKTLLFGTMLCFGLGMVSCSNDDEKIGPDPIVDGDLPLGYVSLELTAGTDMGTKADKVSIGTNAEQQVNKIRLVYYDAKTMIAEYGFTYEAIHSTGQDFIGDNMLDAATAGTALGSINYIPGINGNSIRFIPKAELVKTKDYKLLVLVNPSGTVETATKAKVEKWGIKQADQSRLPGDSALNAIGTNWEVFNNLVASIPEGTNDLSGIISTNAAGKNWGITLDANANFLMSNHRGLIDVPTAKIWTKEVNAYPYGNRVMAQVDRAVAKVTMRTNLTAAETASNAHLSSPSWLLDRTNLKTYYVRHQTATVGGVTLENALTERAHLYAQDPNFDEYSSERYLYYGATVPTGVLAKNPLSKYFNEIAVADFTTANTVANTTTIPSETDWLGFQSEYALENTMVADEQYEDVTTAVILKINYTPKVSALGTTMAAGDKYYVWNGYVFSVADLVKIKKYTPESGQEALFEQFFTLHNYLKDEAGVLEDSGAFGTDYTYNGVSKTVGNLTYNSDAVNYYRILIRHYSNDIESKTMAYGRYGLVRNNWYRLTLNTIKGPGSIDIPDPKGPDDKNDWWVAVDIEVLPWLIREQGIDIE